MVTHPMGFKSQNFEKAKGGLERDPLSRIEAITLFAASVAWIPSQLT